MSLTAPTINTTIDASNYRNEIDDNFSDIQTFMDNTAAEFNADPPATQGYPLTLYYKGALVEGAMPTGFIIPFAAEAISAYARLGTCLTDTGAMLQIELRDSGTNIFSSNVLSWSGGDGSTVQSVSMGGGTLTEIALGSFVEVFTIFDTYDWTGASDLCITLLARRKLLT